MQRLLQLGAGAGSYIIESFLLGDVFDPFRVKTEHDGFHHVRSEFFVHPNERL